MTGKERIKKALNREQPDTVPVWELAFNEASIIGIARRFMPEDKLPPLKMVTDMDGADRFKLINGLATFARELKLDGVTALPIIARERVDETHIRDEFGVVQHVSEWGEPYPVQGPIGDMADLKKYVMRKTSDTDTLLIDVLRSTVPDAAIAFQLQATFKISWSLRGSMETLLEDYIVDPKLAHALARMVTDYCLELVERVASKKVDFIVMDGDLAFGSNSIMSPAHYDEFIGPYHKEIVALAHKHGIKIIKHSDGVLDPLVPGLIESGFDGIHPIQPQCMDIGETKKKWGHKLAVLGNIDCSNLLVFEGPEEVRQSVKETIAAAAPGGGYILSSSNSIHPGVKTDNYLAMVAAAREFGKYPIQA